VIKLNDIDNTNINQEPIYEKDRRIEYFIKLLEKKGFIVQEGKIQYIDILKLVSEGKCSSALGNIVGAPYATYILPPAPNQMPSPAQRPPKGYDPDNPSNYPPNLDFVQTGVHYKLRSDEAIVLIGQTPPPSAYFCFRSYLALVENKPEKDYRDKVTDGDDLTGYYHFIGASLGDQINNYFIWTNKTPYGAFGKPFDASTIIITTADKRINQQMRDALNVSGFCHSIMNNDNIPLDLVNMGLEKGKDHFSFVMRANIFQDSLAGWDYIYNIEKYFTVLRIIPQKPYPCSHPWSIPKMRTREICTNEFQVIPTARNTLDYLRNQIFKKYKNSQYHVIDLDFNLAAIENYESILQDVNTWIDNKDTIYVKTESFQFDSDDDFLIVYGVNSTQTGFADFINVSLYGDELWNGVAGTVFSDELQYPASEYFPECDKNGKNYYVMKLARQSTEGNEVIIPYSTDNPKGFAYGVDNNQKVFLVIRMYINQKTKVASAPFDIIWGHAILFKKRK
jgi:disulfide oxidoreductase YuzD